jgi:predicted O-methyltransferase YrrM
MALDFDAVRLLLEGVPYLDAAAGRTLYDFVRGAGPEACLELGFAHGVSSCYIAAALAARGRGHLTTVDLEASATRAPTIETLLERTGLAAWVTVCREPHSYTWFLKKEIERRTRDGRCEPAYDFCYVDGCKNWTIDGLAFFLVDKLLRRDGWILFDDYGWSYARRARAVGRHTTDGIVHREMSPDQLEQPNVELIFRYLVMQHPDYGEFRVEGDWAWARKARGDRRAPVAGSGKGGGRHDAC